MSIFIVHQLHKEIFYKTCDGFKNSYVFLLTIILNLVLVNIFLLNKNL